MTPPPKSVLEQPDAAAVTVDVPPSGLTRPQDDRGFFGHPRGLSTLFFTEMWERFSYYGIRPMLVLFMTAALAAGGFGFDRPVASSIVGIYAGSVYLASLPGGWIADRWLGLRRAIWYGGLFIAMGHISIATSYFFGRPMFFLGLVLIVLGTGLLKPNISAIVGDLYPEGGARRDAGFSIFYMGINLGATLGPLITAWLRVRSGWHIGFGAAGVGMLIGVFTYRARAGSTLGPFGLKPSGTASQQQTVKRVVLGALVVMAAIFLLVLTGVLPIRAVALAQQMRNIELGMAAVYFAYLFFFAGLTSDELKRVAVIIVLFVFATIFWSAFEQAPTSLNLFAQDFTNRVIFGYEIPPEWLQVVNSFFVITFAPVFAWLWVALAKRGLDLSSPTKFAFGLLLAGLGFLIMVPAANAVIAGGGAGIRVSIWWLSVSYLLQTFGELSLSPVGLSSMTKLAPRKFVGQMMGVWFLAASLGNVIAGIVGGHVDPEKLQEMPALFQQTAMSLLVAAALCGLLVVPIRRMMRSAPT